MRTGRRISVAAALLISTLQALAFAQPAPQPDAAVAPSVSASASAGSEPSESPSSLPQEAAAPPAPPPPPPPPPQKTAAPVASVSAAPVVSAPVLASASASSPAPLPSASAGVTLAEEVVFLQDTRVFTVRVARGGKSAKERAGAASSVLRRALDEGREPEVRVEMQGEGALVLVGARPVIELGPEDAQAAGEPSVQAYAASVSARIRDSIQKEQSRSAALMTILAFALVILCGVMATFLVRKVGQLADKMREWINEHPERLPALKFQEIEVIRPDSLRAALSIGMSAGKALLQIGIVYGWVLITLSLFESTRGYAQRLTGFVFGPLYSLLARLVGSLPLLVVVAIAGIALVVLIRFIALFFDGVARGETTLEWLPADLAVPTSVLVRAAVVLVFFTFAAPLVTGDDSVLARAGTATLVALGLAATPLLASMAVGVTVVYGRRLSVGDFAEVGGRLGRVTAITLLEVRLCDEAGYEVRVPHLLGLVNATRVIGPKLPVTVEVVLSAETVGQEDVWELLREAAATVGERARADLIEVDASGARYRVSVRSSAIDAKARLLVVVAEALTMAEVPFTRLFERS